MRSLTALLYGATLLMTPLHIRLINAQAPTPPVTSPPTTTMAPTTPTTTSMTTTPFPSITCFYYFFFYYIFFNNNFSTAISFRDICRPCIKTINGRQFNVCTACGISRYFCKFFNFIGF